VVRLRCERDVRQPRRQPRPRADARGRSRASQ
jgi:hypothetical protein